MGLGCYPGDDPQFLGMLGMHGTYEANLSMAKCDVMICVGARFDDRVTGDTKKDSRLALRKFISILTVLQLTKILKLMLVLLVMLERF